VTQIQDENIDSTASTIALERLPKNGDQFLDKEHDENKELERAAEDSDEANNLLVDHQQARLTCKLQTTLRQISDVIDEETQALATHAHPDFHDIKAKKARELQTLTLLLDDIKSAEFDERCRIDIQAELGLLQDKLMRNQQLLHIHIEAVDELVEMINVAADARETDGTYDPFSIVKSAMTKQPLDEDFTQ